MFRPRESDEEAGPFAPAAREELEPAAAAPPALRSIAGGRGGGDERTLAETFAHYADDAVPVARALGLGAPRLRLDPALPRQRGARGVALGDTTHLDPARLDRQVLTHELVHQAQARLPASADHGRDAAETEAHELAAHHAATGSLLPPRFAIDLAQPAADSDARQPGVTAAMYLHLHSSRFLQVVQERIAAIEPVLPKGLSWNLYPRFAELILGAFVSRVDGLDLAKADALRALVHPANIFAAVDGGRLMLGFDERGAADHPGDARYGALGLRDWTDAAGRGFAHAIEASLRQSVTRMAARYLATAEHKARRGDAAGVWAITAGELVMSHPMDALVTPALPEPGVLEFETPPGVSAQPGGEPDAPRRKLEARALEWQGAKDPKLWNWVKVGEANATAEEVAEALWGKSLNAYALTAMPPYFGLPKSWARNLPAAAAHAPAKDTETDEDPAAAFARSSLAEEAARAQAGGLDKPGQQYGVEEIGDLLGQMRIQLRHIEPVAAAWGLGEALAGVRAFVTGKVNLLHSDPAAAGEWGSALQLQEEVLLEAATQLVQIQQQLGGGKFDPNDPGAAPYRDLVAAYTRAAATSHLATSSRTYLADAREQQRMLIGRVAADAAHHAEMNVDDMRDVVPDSDAERRTMTERSGALVAEAAKLQSALLDGKLPDADQVDEMLVSADELSLTARLRALGSKLGTVEKEAERANDGFTKKAANLFDGDIWTLSGRAGTLKAKLETIRSGYDLSVANHRIMALGEKDAAVRVRAGRREAVAAARAKLAELQQDSTIEGFLKMAYSEIEDAQTRAVILQIGLLIGISIASAGLGNAATAAARGFLAARSAQTVAATVGLSRTAMATTRVLGLGLESTLNSLGQVAVSGKSFGSAFLEDFLTNLATGGILHGLHGGREAAGIADEAVRAMWKKSAGRVVLEKSLELTGDMLVGAATSYVMNRAFAAAKGEKLHAQTVQGWFLQGAAMAVGRFVNGAAAKQLQRLQKLATVKGWKMGRALDGDVRALQAAAKRLEANPSHDGALDLMRRRGELLQHEHGMLDDLAQNPKLAEQLGGALEKLQEENAAGIAELSGPDARRLILEGAGLRRTIGELAWTGRPGEVDKAVADAQRAGMPARIAHADDKLTIVDIGGTTIQVHAAGPQLPEYPISLARIRTEPRVDPTGLDVELHFFGTTIDGQPVKLGYGKIHLENGKPVDEPELDIQARTFHEGEQHAVKIFDDVAPVPGSTIPRGVGEQTPLTVFALRQVLYYHKRQFGSEPKELYGYLVGSNRLNFQREYVRARYEQGLGHDEALVEAAGHTSFGMHRSEVGYDKFKVDPDVRMTEEDLGPGWGKHSVPTKIRVIASKK